MPDGRVKQGTINYGQVKLIPLGVGEQARLVAEPAREFDLGAGKGRKVEEQIMGGTVGVILDGRGRPLSLPEDTQRRREKLMEWMSALNVYEPDALKGV